MAKTILGKIIAAIGGLFKSIDSEVKKLVPIAINIVEGIKNFNDSGTADFIEFIVTSAIPGTTDDILIAKVRSILKANLPKILVDLKIIDSIALIDNDTDKLKAILSELNVTSTKGILYKGLAGKFLELISDGKFSFDDAVSLTSYYYSQIKDTLK